MDLIGDKVVAVVMANDDDIDDDNDDDNDADGDVASTKFMVSIVVVAIAICSGSKVK